MGGDVGWLELGGGRLCDGWSLSLCHSFGGFDRWGTKGRVGCSQTSKGRGRGLGWEEVSGYSGF